MCNTLKMSTLTKRKHLIYVLLSLCMYSSLYGQSDGEAFRDPDYGIDGVVDLYSMGLENCDLVEVDCQYNQYVIDYVNEERAIKIIKLNAKGAQELSFGNDGLMRIDSVYVQRQMNAKIYEDILYLLADDEDSMYLYSITPDGQFNPEFGEGQRIKATDLPANYNIFEMDIIDEDILVGSWTNNGTPYIYIDKFTLEGVQSTKDTMYIGDNAGVTQLDFRADEQIYLVQGEYQFDEVMLSLKRYKNITELDTSLVYTIAHDNFMNFNYHIDNDEIIVSYMVNDLDIKHERLDLQGQLLYEHVAPKIDTTNGFIYMQRSDILYNSDGYYVLELTYIENWQSIIKLTKYDDQLKIDSAFGDGGSYELGDQLGYIVKWRTYDDLDRIYLSFRAGTRFNMIRTQRLGTAVNEEYVEPLEHVSLYPNPTYDKIVIDLKFQYLSPFQCNILDAQGNLLKHATQQNKSFEIDLSDYPRGVYFINIDSIEGSISKKVIKRN